MSLPQYTGAMVRTATVEVTGSSMAPATSSSSGTTTEKLLVHGIGGWHFVLRSVPCFATGLSLGDIVHCQDRDGTLHLDGVSVRGGASTLRLLIDDAHEPLADNLLWDHPAAAAGWPGMRERIAGQLTTVGCTVERLGRHLLAVSIGPDVDMTSIEQFLNELAADGVLQIQPGYIHQ
ncbi:DUF4265 domain-containing protein [Candidatus Corynebacterium faecigallinarum]|uniref:DUF4265 domain-containing protein n=1 Tax=Candidatus Corynebacterium faecigallinarum TaxID=2838528 RepID=UPI003FD4682D